MNAEEIAAQTENIESVREWAHAQAKESQPKNRQRTDSYLQLFRACNDVLVQLGEQAKEAEEASE